MKPILSTIGLSMPPDFPMETYELIHKQALLHANDPKFPHKFFGGAWNAIAFRFLAVTDYEENLRVSFTEHGTNTAPHIRYQQERDLFGFFSSGV